MVFERGIQPVLSGLLVVVLSLFLSASVTAVAVYDNSSLGINQCGNITQSGAYVLNQSFSFNTGVSCVANGIAACICIQAASVSVSGANFSITSGNTSIGIYAANKNDVSVGNLTLVGFSHGLLFDNVSTSVIQSVNLTNNTVSGITLQNLTSSSISDIISTSDKHVVTYWNVSSSTLRRFIILNATSESILLRWASYVTVQNVFAANSSYDSKTISLENSARNNLENISLMQSLGTGIGFVASEHNTVINSVINHTNGDAIQVASGNNNTFNAVVLGNTSLGHYDLNISDYVNDSTLTDIPFLTSYTIGMSGRNDSNGSTLTIRSSQWGEVTFILPFNATGTNLSNEVRLFNNSFYVNTSRFAPVIAFNVTMKSIATNLKDYAMVRDGSSCSAPTCNNFTSLAAGTVRFNATGATTYSITGSAIPASSSSDDDDDSTTESSSDASSNSSNVFWSQTYIRADKELSQYATVNIKLRTRERVRVKVDGLNHHVGVISLTSTSAKVNVSSISQQATLDLGGSEKFEVTGDNYYDVLVTLNKIANNTANITVMYIHEIKTATSTVVQQTSGTARTLSATQNQTNATLAGVTKAKSTGSGKTWFGILAMVMLSILGGSGYFYWVEWQKFNRLKNSVRVKSP